MIIWDIGNYSKHDLSKMNDNEVDTIVMLAFQNTNSKEIFFKKCNERKIKKFTRKEIWRAYLFTLAALKRMYPPHSILVSFKLILG